MFSLLCLPEEILLHILVLLGPVDVRPCQQVCRALNTLVAGSPRLLFSLALDSLGYKHPLVSLSNLSPSESLKLLHEHRLHWLRPNAIQPTQHGLRAQSISSQYVGGVYAQGFGTSGFLGANAMIRDIEFYQMPSKNLGARFRRWRLDNLGPGVQDFIFDPDQDLLVLLEIPAAATQYSATCTVHLRTMGEGGPHPRALAPTITANFPEEAGSEGTVPNWGYHFEVVGQLVGILFQSRSKGCPSWVVIWDWVRGLEVTRVSTVGGWHSSFILLNRRTLLLPRPNDSRHTRKFSDSSTFGSIEVHAFDPEVNTSTPPRMVASFGLPSFNQKDARSTLRLRCTPNVRTAYQSPGRPKVYEPFSEHPLVGIDMHLSQFRGSGQITESAGTLYVPASVFLDSDGYTQETSVFHNIIHKIYTRSVPEVPWHKWAGRTSWVDMGDSQANGDCLMYGYRMGSLSNRVGIMSPASRVHLLDFNHHRLKARMANASQAPGRAAEKHSLGSIFNGKGPSSTTKYTETVLEVEGGVDIFDEVILDDEHVIIVRKGEPEIAPSLLVYTF